MNAALKSRMTPAEERAQRDAMSVALAQPHRRGGADPKLGTPLGRLCSRLRLREELYQAGESYAAIVRADKLARGFHVDGVVSDGEANVLTLAEQDERRQAAAAKVRDANAVLRGVSDRAPAMMVRICQEEREPLAYDSDDAIRNCLWRLSIHFGMIKLGIAGGAQ